MSSQSDKAKAKLLSSMRKTKAGTTESAAAPAPAQETKPAAPKPAAKVVAKAKPKAKPKAKKAKKKPVATAADPFQSAGRIWPD